MSRRWRFMAFSNGADTIRFTYLKKPKTGMLGYAGIMESSLFDEIIVVVDNRPEEDKQYDLACALQTGKNGYSGVILDRDIFTGFLQGSDMARMTVFHEIGHIYHKDVLRHIGNEERKKIVEQGEVSIPELEADRFAADFLGTDTVINGLGDLREEAMALYGENHTEETDLVLQELKLRQVLLTESNSDNLFKARGKQIAIDRRLL